MMIFDHDQIENQNMDDKDKVENKKEFLGLPMQP